MHCVITKQVQVQVQGAGILEVLRGSTKLKGFKNV